MPKIRVMVHGASGKMGQTVIAALSQEPDMELVGAADIKAACDSFVLPDGRSIPLSTDAESMLDSCKPDVVVDFSTAKAILPLVRATFKRGVRLVSGTTGISQAELSEIDTLAKQHKVGAIIASNFAIGAIVMMHLARVAAKYFDYAEIIEEHHQFKLDAPSGTALATARAMAKERGQPFVTPEPKEGVPESRGQKLEGIAIHSVRLPGIVARQEVLLGGMGQTLSIKHDAISRDCYMPGVMLAVREVSKHTGLIFGLDTLLGL
ncbi:MAG: 4-hydroxy-tetrahydrodipicolinate reductase [Dehalococcoidales bacterium]